MDARIRREFIEQRVRADREIGYAELAAEFDVSEMTIRRDVEALETLGVVRRVVGGAIALKGKDSEPSFETRVANAAEEKRHIADAVADLIGSSETLILDSGQHRPGGRQIAQGPRTGPDGRHARACSRPWSWSTNRTPPSCSPAASCGPASSA